MAYFRNTELEDHVLEIPELDLIQINKPPNLCYLTERETIIIKEKICPRFTVL